MNQNEQNEAVNEALLVLNKDLVSVEKRINTLEETVKEQCEMIETIIEMMGKLGK